MGLLDRLLGERQAKAVQQVYDRTANAANRGVDYVNSGLNEIDAYRQANLEKQRNGTTWYDQARNGIGQFVDDAQAKAAEMEAYRRANLQEQGRKDPLQGIRSFFS